MKESYAKIGDITIRTIEECSELIHALCKARRFGWDCYHPDDNHMTPNSHLVGLEIEDLRKCLNELEKDLKK